jgi:hypothetical protein
MGNIKKGPCITTGLTGAWKVRTAFKNSKYCAATEFLKTGTNLPVSECREIPDQPSNTLHRYTARERGVGGRQTRQIQRYLMHLGKNLIANPMKCCQKTVYHKNGYCNLPTKWKQLKVGET